MITNKQELKEYLKADYPHLTKKSLFVKWITCTDDYYVIIFMRCLRYYEYYSNKRKNVFDYIPFLWYWWNYRRLRRKSNIFIEKNCVGSGCKILHPGFRRIGSYVKIGKNCTILPMVLIGKSNLNVETPEVILGDNCYIGTGVTIVGPIHIGDNVTIGAGAVVTKDVPDNAIVGGVPAKILKIKS